ncbi:MAG: UDP-N-acetylmuramate--L-alanine ligase [Alphaproteobacteria bacterium ADurb.Bin438]|nr:MAG: UDP-N-acetylmuramate--L-alanine ligase [Alphaproteobacteria bacterium ADurb.Bin438]
MLNILNNNPLVINGGIMTNYNQTYLNGNGISVAEADESNGTIELYEPTYSLISNISLDHKSLEELLELFTNFIKKTEKKCVLNADCKFSFGLINDENKDKVVTFGIENDLADFNAYSIKLGAQSSGFSLKGVDFTINMAGIHNIYNALSAVAVLNINGYELESIANALRSFKGIKRRMEFIGSFNEIDVIDDFAHNPDKIANAINSVKPYCEGRLITIFQPHGFAPTRLMKDGYIESFVSTLSKNDIVIMPEIYYAGGQVVRDISAKDLTSEIEKSGIKSYFFENRADILAVLKEIAKPKDKIMVMGARDNSLNEFAKEILEFMEN